MKTSFFKSLALVLFLSGGLVSECIAQWTQLPVYAGHDFLKIDFPDDNTGYAKVYETDSAAYHLAKTSDGGTTWDHLSMSSQFTGDLQNFHFSHPDTGLIAWRAVSTAGTRVERTYDGGATWTDISPDTSNLGIGTCGLFVVDGNEFHFSVGGMYYRTTDGGTSWDTTSLGNNYIEVLDFADAQHGMGGIFDGTFNYGGGVYHTSDGGQTLTPNIFPQTSSMVSYLSYPAVGEAYAFTNMNYNTRIHRSTDGGITWDSVQVNISPFDQMAGMAFKAGGHGFIITNFGYILSTTDGGDNWTEELIPDTTSINALTLSENKAWIGGVEGRLFVMDILNSTLPAKELKTFTVFPNPLSGNEELIVRVPDANRKISFRIYDMTGKPVAAFETGNEMNSILLPNLQAGIYFLDAKGFAPQRFVVVE